VSKNVRRARLVQGLIVAFVVFVVGYELFQADFSGSVEQLVLAFLWGFSADLSLSGVLALAQQGGAPRAAAGTGAVGEALFRTRTGDPFLPWQSGREAQARGTRGNACREPKTVIRQSSAAQRSPQQAALPTGYPAVEAPARSMPARV
jgi:hypothetical protein